MNCRPFVVIAVVFGGLVPVAQLASAELPTRRIATATATILSPVTMHDISRQAGQEKNPDGYSGRNILIKYIDDHGFVAATASPQHRKIIVIDMP
jgi:hypothetical protein